MRFKGVARAYPAVKTLKESPSTLRWRWESTQAAMWAVVGARLRSTEEGSASMTE